MQNGEPLGDKSERVDPPADRASRAVSWAIIGAAGGSLIGGPLGAAAGGIVGGIVGALNRDLSLRFDR